VKATLTRSGATGYSTANWKSYDVWGGERASTGSGSMFGYCGNLGHPTDPENGLIYMRARFYEPWTGRFLSEDSAKDGVNWYSYAANRPSDAADASGNVWHSDTMGWFGIGAAISFGAFRHFYKCVTISDFKKGLQLMSFAVAAYVNALTNEIVDEAGGKVNFSVGVFTFLAVPSFQNMLDRLGNSVMGSKGMARAHGASIGMMWRMFDYSLLVIAALVLIDTVGSGD
jgi:RHS repeat-associated protein